MFHRGRITSCFTGFDSTKKAKVLKSFTQQSGWIQISQTWSQLNGDTFLNGPIPVTFSFTLSSFSHCNYNYNNINRRKHRWFAWDSNPGPKDVGADKTTELWRWVDTSPYKVSDYFLISPSLCQLFISFLINPTLPLSLSLSLFLSFDHTHPSNILLSTLAIHYILNKSITL